MNIPDILFSELRDAGALVDTETFEDTYDTKTVVVFSNLAEDSYYQPQLTFYLNKQGWFTHMAIAALWDDRSEDLASISIEHEPIARNGALAYEQSYMLNITGLAGIFSGNSHKKITQLLTGLIARVRELTAGESATLAKPQPYYALQMLVNALDTPK